MSWTKLTEDKATWPDKDSRYCWVRTKTLGLIFEKVFTFDPDFECFWTTINGEIQTVAMDRVGYCAPATPPQFEEEG